MPRSKSPEEPHHQQITDSDIFAITDIIITNRIIMSNLCEESRHNVLLVGGALSAKTWVSFLSHSQVQHLPKVWICFGFLFFFSTIILSIQRIYYDNDDDDFTSPSRSDSQAVFTTEAKVSKESDTACLRTWFAEMLTKDPQSQFSVLHSLTHQGDQGVTCVQGHRKLLSRPDLVYIMVIKTVAKIFMVWSIKLSTLLHKYFKNITFCFLTWSFSSIP